MSHVLTAEQGPYTLEVTHAPGTAPDVGTARMGITPVPVGDLRRTSGNGLYPIEYEALFEDPRDEIKDALVGDIVEKDFEATLTGPPGPNGTPFDLRLFPKARRRTDPLSKKVHPDKTKVTFYDGLSRLKDPSSASVSTSSVGSNRSIQSLIDSALSVANADLHAIVSIDVQHGFPDNNFSATHGPEDLDKITFPIRQEERWDTYWEALETLASEYHLAIFQDPYDHQSSKPRWKIIARTMKGAKANGIRSDSAPFSGTFSTETLSADEVRVQENSLVSKSGDEYENAVMTQVDEELPESSSGTEEKTSLLLNADQVLRDGNFNFKRPSNDNPIYGIIQQGDINVDLADNDIKIDPPPSNFGVYLTEGFYVGRGSVYMELDYVFTRESGDQSPSGGSYECILKLVRNGNVQSSVSSGLTASTIRTLTLNAEGPGVIRVEVRVPFDNDSSQKGAWEARRLEIWRSQMSADNSEDPNVETVRHREDKRGFLTSEIKPRFDKILEGLDTNDSAPCSEYSDSTRDVLANRIGELAAKLRFQSKPLGTQTLRTTLDQVIGPNTRVKIVDETDTVQREFVMHGGRTMHPKDGYTELADIETPHP